MSESTLIAFLWMATTGLAMAAIKLMHDVYFYDPPPPVRWLVHSFAINFVFGFFLEAAFVVFDESQIGQAFYRQPDVAGIFAAVAAAMLGLQRLHEKDRPTS